MSEETQDAVTPYSQRSEVSPLAFPQPQCPQCGTEHAPHSPHDEGMMLRDYFAAKAATGAADVLCDMLQPLDAMDTFDPVAKLEEVKRHAAQHAMVAYIYADAMLKAREGR